jgi:hypothetical protein
MPSVGCGLDASANCRPRKTRPAPVATSNKYRNFSNSTLYLHPNWPFDKYYPIIWCCPIGHY